MIPILLGIAGVALLCLALLMAFYELRDRRLGMPEATGDGWPAWAAIGVPAAGGVFCAAVAWGLS